MKGRTMKDFEWLVRKPAVSLDADSVVSYSWTDETDIQVRIRIERDSLFLTPQQALALRAWLEQERSLLEQLIS